MGPLLPAHSSTSLIPGAQGLLQWDHLLDAISYPVEKESVKRSFPLDKRQGVGDGPVA